MSVVSSVLLSTKHDAIYVIQGKKATSYEFNVSVALDEKGLEYEFQVEFYQGKRVTGGFVIDFLVMTKPEPTPVFVNGEFWHRDKERDLLQTVALKELGYTRVVSFWGVDCSDIDAARIAVKRELMVT